MIDLGRAQESRILAHVVVPVEADVAEGDLHELAHRVAHAGRHDEVVGLILLQHQPHRAHVVAGKPPVALCVEVAEAEVIGQPQLDARHRRR